MYGLIFYLVSGVVIAQVLRIEYFASRFFSLLILSLIVFLFSFFFPFKPVFYTSFLIFLVVGAIQIKRKGFNFDYRSETTFLMTFLFFLFLRSLDPSAYGAEKLMDYAFLNTVLNAQHFHPPDPFFAHGTLNFYYYFGYVIGAAITLMSFLPLEIGFNVAIASIPAYFAMLGYGLLRNLLDSGGDEGGKRDTSGLILATVFMAFSGNLYAVYEFFRDIVVGKLPGFLYYWNATRIIDDTTYGKTINEFPYFSFIHADYHAHFVALPIKLLAIFFLYRYMSISNKHRIYGFCLIPTIFILFATNSWDAPIFLFIISLVVLYRFFKQKEKSEFFDGTIIIVLSVLSIAALYATMKIPAAKPFFTSERTVLWQFFLYFGIIILLNYVYLWNEIHSRLGVISILVGVLGYVISPVMPLVFPLTILGLKRFSKGDFPSLLIFSASLLILSCEFIAIESRLNTFFKFYLAAWVLLSVPAAICIGRTFSDFNLCTKSVFQSKSMRYLVASLMILSLVYPTIATPVRYYKAEFSLDSSKFIRDISIDDYNAIQFLKEKRGIIVESAEGCYTFGSRVAAFTANPTLVAWSCHEVQWRGNPEELARRMAEVRAIYKSKNCEAVHKIIERYNVSYIFLGYQERLDYGVSDLKCFKEIYRSGNTVVYSAKS